MKNLVIVSLASLALVGCGKGRSNNPFRALATAKKAPELQGTYESACVSSSKGVVAGVFSGVKSIFKGKNDTYPNSARTLLMFQGESATVKEVHYLGANCDGGEAYAFVEKGSFKVGDKDNNEKNNAGRFLDVAMKTVETSILSPEGAEYANIQGLCGKKDWKADDKAVDVTAKSAGANCYEVTPQRSVATVYQVDNSTLALGYTGSDAVKAESRSTSIDTVNTFRRK